MFFFRLDTGLVEKEILPFDWTFTTDYSGTLNGDWIIESSPGTSINWDRLKQKDKILLFQDITLFEDELHDNGISILSVKIVSYSYSFFSRNNRLL